VCDGLPLSFIPSDIQPTHFVGTTADELHLSSERINAKIEAYMLVSEMQARVVFLLGELVVATSYPVPATWIRFGLTNFHFIGNDVEQTDSGIHRLLVLQLRNLANTVDVKIRHVERYYEIVHCQSILNDISVTCEAEIALSQCSDTSQPAEIASHLCYVLSVAAGTKIQWIYSCEYGPLHQPVRRVHAARVTKRYNPLVAVDANDGNYDFQTFVERAYPAYVEKRIAFRLDEGAIDSYLDAKAAGDYLETRGVKLAIALETLKSILLDLPDIGVSRFVMPKPEFDRLWPKCQKALSQTLEQQGIEQAMRARLYENRQALNNTPFKQLIERLCVYLKLAVAQDDIRLFVTCRNKLVHEGRFYCRAATAEERAKCPPLASPVLEYMFLVNFLDRIFLKLLGYDGPYIECRSIPAVRRDRI
jgi:hypothetical protein